MEGIGCSSEETDLIIHALLCELLSQTYSHGLTIGMSEDDATLNPLLET